MPDPELFDAIARLGAGGLLAIAVWALATGRVVRGAEVAQLRAERNEYRDLHSSALARLDRITDGIELLTKTVERLDAQRQQATADAVSAVLKRLEKP